VRPGISVPPWRSADLPGRQSSTRHGRWLTASTSFRQFVDAAHTIHPSLQSWRPRFSGRCDMGVEQSTICSSRRRHMSTFRRHLKPWLQLRFVYDTTTIRLRRIARLLPFDAKNSFATLALYKFIYLFIYLLNMPAFRRSRVVVVPQSNRNSDIGLKTTHLSV